MKTPANRRENPRIDIKLRCHITAPAVCAQNVAYTENISRGGVLIGWPVAGEALAPAVGQIVTVEIELPAHHGFGQKCIHCQGTVIRIMRPGEDLAQMALQVNYMDFRSFHDGLRPFEIHQPLASAWTA